ncbi:MAG: pyruvate:ferredoxin (flavodoxin) oxidoreductase [Betaproteobacteria bacterium RIFCSPLOWO2_12_FULL_64_23]|nr:MAG: pyruvate:ferredoxin (flavodoxin) oxidoreductase [Betaproteobacteria bacterium RIFCSPLOWO2_12_FULL_64_23]
MSKRLAVLEGNEAAARIAHLTNEVIAIYPITPSSGMGEFADAWSAAGQKNLWGAIPEVIEMQSEAGAAGAVHGSLQAGALTTTFTASQGLLLMLPNMFKIAGELTPAVFHIAARTVATHALSIFGDHSDVMAARMTGWAMLAAASVQEAQDMAMIAQMATLRSRVPFMHFFDGFRTSHEVNRLELLLEEEVRQLIDEELVTAHRARSLNPDRPVLRGSAQNPDVFFQAREACNLFYMAVPGIVQESMDRLAKLTSRRYKLFDYQGAADAERVLVQMGSGVGASGEAVRALAARGEKVGLLTVRLYRPFDTQAFIAALPRSVRAIAVLDRTKEPGAIGEPMYQDIVTALVEAWPQDSATPRVIGGRYGLSSKEYTPAMAKAALDELAQQRPKRHFTVGIVDDVTRLSLAVDDSFDTEADDVTCAVFYGLGADGTVGATKNSVKIIGENTPLHAQGYFVYDSKKSGAVTISHLRFGPRPIESTYLIRQADFVACHQFEFMEKLDVLALARPGATFLLNSPYGPDEVWDKLPREAQEQILDKKLKMFVVDALAVAKEAGLAGRINTVTQACFFAISGILPRDEAIEQIKHSIRKTYGKRGESVLNRNFAAVDQSLAALREVQVPGRAGSALHRRPVVPRAAPDFVQRVTAMMLGGKGDLLPVSALPIDGTFPTATSQWEKHSIAHEIPIWDAAICTQCALCPLMCPHAAIRMNVYSPEQLKGAPAGFKSVPWRGKEAGALEGWAYTLQVAPDDCTGCGICVDICPTRSKEMVKHKAINMEPKLEHLELERRNYEFFLSLPETRPPWDTIDALKGSQLRTPLFEYSGACAGCGETPYVKLLSQLYGDHLLVANATGCSSIYGGNLPSTPWAQNSDGQGPAWANSLFEDNAEFGLGMRLALDAQRDLAQALVRELHAEIGDGLSTALLEAPQESDQQIRAQRERVKELKTILSRLGSQRAQQLLAVADSLITRSVWIVGGDGWAYDIGYGGLDHVLASGRNVNILVLDTEVYSNTGGQASKSTQRGAVAKFAAAGKSSGKKDLGMIAMAYGNVYVAQVAMGANPMHTVRTFQEAASWPGPSLIIAYSQCIAHGIDMATGMSHQREAVKSGYLTLYHYDPRLGMGGASQPLKLDSRKPTMPVERFTMKEGRYAMLVQADPERAKQLMKTAQSDADARWRLYEQVAGVQRTVTEDGKSGPNGDAVAAAAPAPDPKEVEQ